MIFKQAQQVLDGTKRQTRRPVKQGDIASHDENGNIVAVFRRGRLLWRVGKDYAVQPGRGKKALGRTDPLKAIRRERLQDISLEDIGDEGITEDDVSVAWGPMGGKGKFAVSRHLFRRLWNSLYRKPYLWKNNPEVWALVW